MFYRMFRQIRSIGLALNRYLEHTEGKIIKYSEWEKLRFTYYIVAGEVTNRNLKLSR